MEKLEKALKLRKAKYIKRTGSPGSYKYVYREPAGRKKEVKADIPERLKDAYDNLGEGAGGQGTVDRAIAAGYKPDAEKLISEAWEEFGTHLEDNKEDYFDDWVETLSKKGIKEIKDMGLTLGEAFDELTGGDIASDLYDAGEGPPADWLDGILYTEAKTYLDKKKGFEAGRTAPKKRKDKGRTKKYTNLYRKNI